MGQPVLCKNIASGFRNIRRKGTTDISSQFITIIAFVLAFTLSDNHHLASTRPPLDFGIEQFSLMSTLLLSLLLFKYFNVDGCHTLRVHQQLRTVPRQVEDPSDDLWNEGRYARNANKRG